jgi:hypothetical protein
MHAPADALAGLEHQQFAVAQLPGRAQAADAGANDDDVVVRMIRSDGSPFACFVC